MRVGRAASLRAPRWGGFEWVTSGRLGLGIARQEVPLGSWRASAARVLLCIPRAPEGLILAPAHVRLNVSVRARPVALAVRAAPGGATTCDTIRLALGPVSDV